MMFPLVTFDAVSLPEANALLEAWGHKMGPLARGHQSAWCHALRHEGEPVAITAASYLINATAGRSEDGLGMTRENTVEAGRRKYIWVWPRTANVDPRPSLISASRMPGEALRKLADAVWPDRGDASLEQILERAETQRLVWETAHLKDSSLDQMT